MRLPRIIAGLVTSSLLAMPASRLAILVAGAFAATGCSVDCTVGSVMPETLPNGRVGQPYFLQLEVEATGQDCRGTSFEPLDTGEGGLPAGMKLSQGGAIDGTPLRAGTHAFEVVGFVIVENPTEIIDLRTATRRYELTILPR